MFIVWALEQSETPKYFYSELVSCAKNPEDYLAAQKKLHVDT